jgi:hypothetical protein
MGVYNRKFHVEDKEYDDRITFRWILGKACCERQNLMKLACDCVCCPVFALAVLSFLVLF